MAGLSAIDKIIRARSKLQEDNPFFAYLVLHLNLKCDNEKCPTMAINANGDLFFNEGFVNSLSEDELKFCVCHEVMHVALEHCSRVVDINNAHIWNFATDTVINDMLIESKMAAPKGVITPVNHEISVNGHKIKEVNKKTAERAIRVYDSESAAKKHFGDVWPEVGGYFIEHRPGEDIRCEQGYCSVRTWCPYYTKGLV